MIYKYIFYKIYECGINWFDPTAPQISTTIILSFFPFTILVPVFRLIKYFNIPLFSSSSQDGFPTTLFVMMFIFILVFNIVYFFSYHNWKEIIIFFRNNEISKKTKVIAKFYIVYCTSIIAYLFLFLGFEF